MSVLVFSHTLMFSHESGVTFSSHMRFLPSAADDRRLSQDNGPVEMTAARVDRDVVSVPCVGGVSRLI